MSTPLNDTVIVNDTSGNDSIGYNPSNAIGSGAVTVNLAPPVAFTSIEALFIDGQGGFGALAHTTPAGVHQVPLFCRPSCVGRTNVRYAFEALSGRSFAPAFRDTAPLAP